MEIQQINSAVAELQEAFDAIQQSRSNYALKRFVVGEKDTPAAQWAQCVLEMQIKHQAIRRAQLAIRKLEIEAARLHATGDEIDALTALEKGIDIEDTQRAMLGAMREFECLYRIFKGFPQGYSYAELQAAQPEYWQARGIRESSQQIDATGRIQAGHLDLLRMMGAQQIVSNDGQACWVFPAAEQPKELNHAGS